MATSSSNITTVPLAITKKFEEEMFITLFRSFHLELIYIRGSCFKKFERDFWKCKIEPLKKKIENFLRSKESVVRCGEEAVVRIEEISRFKHVYGVVEDVLNLLKKINSTLAKHGVVFNPKQPKSLFFLAKKAVISNPELEEYLYNANVNLPEAVAFSYESYFNGFSPYMYFEKRRDSKFCSNVVDTLNCIRNEGDIRKKVEIARKFLRKRQTIKLDTICKKASIHKLKGFIDRYENYL